MEPHCQSHLTGIVTKRCGTITYCHTLVRPGYCPFCMSDLALPVSKRLESWTRDYKLWSHVNEHLGQCRWPRVCPHPLCDTFVEDAVALQFHLMDEHGFSRTRPGKAANPAAFDSQDEKIQLGDKAHDTRPNRKRKSSSSATRLEWMPPRSIDGRANVWEEPSLGHPQKRPRQTPLAVCPTALTLDQSMSDNQTAHNTVDSIMLSPPYSLSIEK